MSYDDDYRGSGDRVLSFKEIIILHIRKIGNLASVELMGGYWEERIIKGTNETIKLYVPDTREMYSHAIWFLHDTLYPHFDEEMLNASENYVGLMKELEDRYIIDTQFENVTDRAKFRERKVKYSRILFKEICCFLFRKRYLDVGEITDQ